MSNAGNPPDPNELNLPGEDEPLEGLEGLDLPDSDASDPLGGLEDLDLPAIDEGLEEAAPAGDAIGTLDDESADAGGSEETVSPEEEESPKDEPREGIGMAGLAVFGFCGLSVLLLLALDAMVFMGWGIISMLFMNVFWLMATAIPFIMWMGREKLNFFEVALGIALAAIVISVSLLLIEFMVRYEGEATPKGGAAAAVHSGSDNTIAVA